MRKAHTAAAVIMTAAALAAAPVAASAASGPAVLAADYTSSGALGSWNAQFRGKATVNDDGTFHVSGHLQARCPGGIVGGFGRFGFRNQDIDTAWQTFEVKCSSDGSTSMMIEADEIGDPGENIGITVCMGGLLTYTECGGEETVTLTE